MGVRLLSQVLMERGATAKMSFINGGLSQKTVVVGCNNNNNNNHMRERSDQAASSFPSNYLSPSDRHHHFLARCTILDDSSELSIFDAKKYFNEVSSANNNINKVSPITTMPEQCVDHPPSAVVSKFSAASASVVDDGYRRSYRARSFHAATPTASSEASWNSQTGLLSNPPGAISVSVLRDSDHLERKKTRKPPSSAARWIFRSSKCPCTGKKSVQVQESKVLSDPKSSPPYINNSAAAVGGHSQPKPESPPDPVKSSISVEENTMLLQSDSDVVWSTAQRRRSFVDQPAMADINNPSSQLRFPPNLLLQGQTTQRVMASGRPFNGHQHISCALPAAGFTFPILKNNSNDNGDFPVRSASSVASNTALIEDPPRDSLEVFKPSSGRDGGHNQVVSFTLRGSPKSRILATAAASGATIVGDIDDVASDASSDLFEIESFSTQTASTATYHHPAMFHRRDSMEEARRLASRRSLDEPMTPSTTDWYEPSEASIDWSVTTAEGFDRASVTNMSVTASEAEEFSAMMRRGEAEKNSNGGNNNSRRRSSSGNGLLSCRSEKAVSVGPQPVKFITDDADRDRWKGPGRTVNSGTKHVGSRPPLGKKPPLARSHSARLSLTFAA